VREIRTLRAMWRALETELRQFLNGHAEGNLGYKPRKSLRVTAPVLDPTGVRSGKSRMNTSRAIDSATRDRQRSRNTQWAISNGFSATKCFSMSMRTP
jgi:hypothetical protein